MTFPKMTTVPALTLLLATLAAPADVDAGWCRHHRRPRCRPAVAARAAPCMPAVASPQWTPMPGSYPDPQAATGDAGSFLAWLNGYRAANGRGPVGWSGELAGDAAANSARGFGHSYMGRARRQNAGVGPLGSVQVMWMASPAHASALLDPGITAVAVANVGGVWTYSAY